MCRIRNDHSYPSLALCVPHQQHERVLSGRQVARDPHRHTHLPRRLTCNRLVEYADTRTIFMNPANPQTEAYVSGRFG